MRLIRVEWDHPDAVVLRDAMVAEVAALYSSDRSLAPRDGNSGLDPATMVVTGLVYEGETPIAHVALRRLGEDLEIKRMFVAVECRGRGLSKYLLEEMERVAREEGASRIILHTGNQQVAAIALYEANGYTEIEIYEPYVGLPDSLCFEKALS